MSFKLTCCAGLAAVLLLAMPVAAGAQLPPGIAAKCLAPAGNPAPGSAAWQQRDLINNYCSQLRLRDQLDNPAYAYLSSTQLGGLYAAQAQEQLADGPSHVHGGITTLIPGAQNGDPFRNLDRWTGAHRGQVKRIAFTALDGAQLRGHVFLPPPGTPKPAAGYPGIVITDGSVQAYEQLYYWAAEGLAEAGYEVMTYDVQGQGDSDVAPANCVPSQALLQAGSVCTGVPYQQNYNFYQGAEDSLSYFLSDKNPYRTQLNGDDVGIAGHSLGAAGVSVVGQCDTRVKTIVAWDDLSVPADCSGVTVPPQYRSTTTTRVGALALTNDYGFTPQPMTSPPDPQSKAAGYKALVKAGLDSMQVAFRGATHLTYSYIPNTLPSSQLAERFAFYYTLAWFDRYLKGDRSGYARLTARSFDRSSDVHSIGAGTYSRDAALANPADPTAGNVPYRIKGLRVDNIVSFYYESQYSLTDPSSGGLRTCLDMRTNCTSAPPTP
jgi:dienelactone hydrolase